MKGCAAPDNLLMKQKDLGPNLSKRRTRSRLNGSLYFNLFTVSLRVSLRAAGKGILNSILSYYFNILK
jgi:hypothetical protein